MKKVESDTINNASQWTGIKNGTVIVSGRNESSNKGGLYIVDNTGAIVPIINDSDLTLTLQSGTLTIVSATYNKQVTVIGR